MMTLLASSLAFIILFSVIVRESSYSMKFDTDKIEKTFFIVIIGTAISIAVSVLIWPVRSIKKLKYVIYTFFCFKIKKRQECFYLFLLTIIILI